MPEKMKAAAEKVKSSLRLKKTTEKMEREAAETPEWPDFVIQKVQSFLSLEDAARTCTVNKAWLSSWKTHPVLVFKRSRFRSLDEYKFLMLITDTLVSYRRQNLLIKQLSLYLDATLYGSKVGLVDCLNSWPSPVRNWIETATECGLESLSIRFLPGYLIRLSPFKINSLRELSFFGGQFAKGVKIDVCCPILVSLKLIGVRIDKRGIHQFISNCPLIETLIVEDCRGFKKIDVARLEHIKEFKLAVPATRTVEIEAPAIGLVAYKGLPQQFSVFDEVSVFGFWVSPDQFGVSGNMTKLDLQGPVVTNSLLDELLFRLPFLTDLTLKHCELNGRMDITCCSLEKLSFTYMSELTKFKIGAPKLLFMEYTGRTMPVITFTQKVNLQKLKSRITLVPIGSIYRDWLYSLRTALLKLHQSEVVIKVHKYAKAVFSPKKLKALSPLPWVQDVYLDINSSSCSMGYFILESLLYICRPQYISAKGSWDFLVEELVSKPRKYHRKLGRKVQACCAKHKVKCWRCRLEEVEVGWKSEDGEGELQPLPEEDWINGSADCAKQKSFTWMTFRLNW